MYTEICFSLFCNGMTFGHDPIDLPLLVDGPCKEDPLRMEAVEWSFTWLNKSTLPRLVITSTFYNAWFQLIIHHAWYLIFYNY